MLLGYDSCQPMVGAQRDQHYSSNDVGVCFQVDEGKAVTQFGFL